MKFAESGDRNYCMFIFLDTETKGRESDNRLCQLAFKTKNGLIVNELFKDIAAAEMIKISNNPILINRMPYGKHKGIRFTEIPLDYLQWLLTTKLDVDMAYTVRHHLGIGD